VLYFSGGLAAIPFLAPLVTQLGAATIAAATPVLAVAEAFLWNAVAKPLGNLVARGFRGLRPSRPANANPPPVEVALSEIKAAAPSSRPQSTPSVSQALSAAPGDRKSDPVLPQSRQPDSVTETVGTPPTVPVSGSEVKEDKYGPGKGGTALVLVGNEIDLSYMYDTLTIYPKTDAEFQIWINALRNVKSSPLHGVWPASWQSQSRKRKQSANAKQAIASRRWNMSTGWNKTDIFITMKMIMISIIKITLIGSTIIPISNFAALFRKRSLLRWLTFSSEKN
jgi:hypothetical protein